MQDLGKMQNVSMQQPWYIAGGALRRSEVSYDR